MERLAEGGYINRNCQSTSRIYCQAAGFEPSLTYEESGTMIELENRGEITILRMARGKGNALDFDFLLAIVEALEQIERGAARAAVITGQGSTFGAGVDLPALIAGGPDYVRRFLPKMSQTFERLATFPKPLVAAVNGHAIAGGAIIMLACDQRLLARGSARIGLTEVHVGVLFPAWPLEIARFATPPQHLSSIVCAGRTWPPGEALARGLVDELVDPQGLLDRACEVAGELAAIDPATFTAAKRAVRQPLVEAARRQSAAGDAAVTEHWCSLEVQRHIADFAARTIKRRT
jgi:enoyl-CoA hydratase